MKHLRIFFCFFLHISTIICEAQVDSLTKETFGSMYISFFSGVSDPFFKNSGNTPFDIYLIPGFIYKVNTRYFSNSNKKKIDFTSQSILRMPITIDLKSENKSNIFSGEPTYSSFYMGFGFGYEQEYVRQKFKFAWRVDVKYHVASYLIPNRDTISGTGLGIEPGIILKIPIGKRFEMSSELFYGYRNIKSNSIYHFDKNLFGIRLYFGYLIRKQSRMK